MKKQLLCFVGICSAIACCSVLAEEVKAFEQAPTYSDKQQHSLVNKESLMANTSSEAYVDEFTDPFSSFYIGIGGSSSQTKTTYEEKYSHLDPLKLSNTYNKTGIHLLTGFGKTFGNTYFGGEIFLNNVKSDSNNLPVYMSDYNFGGDLRFGYLVTRSLMLYALAGIDVAKYKNNFTSFYADSYKLGLMPGVGAEFLLNDNWGIRAQYTYSMYSKEEYEVKDVYSKEFKADRGSISFSLVYHFN